MTRTQILVAATAALVLAATANAQPGGGGGGGGRGGRGGRGGGGGGGFDPSQMFDRFSGGKDVIVIDQLDERMKPWAQRMADAAGITNGQITRAQFPSVMEAARSNFGGGGRGPGGGNQPAASAPSGKGNEMTPEQIDRKAEDSFRQHDKNGDGQLQYDEMPDNLKSGLDKYDANKDGTINLEEYKSYYRDRIQVRLQEQAQKQDGQSADGLPPAPDSVSVQEEEKRTAIFRYGKMPKEMPAWFTELDADKDGQVGLYEWVKAGRSIDEFKAMDRNDDGLLTAEEVLSYVRANSRSPGNDAVAVASPGEGNPRNTFGGFGGGGPGGMQGFGRGRGGMQGGGQGGESPTGGMQGMGRGRGGMQGGGAPGGGMQGFGRGRGGQSGGESAQPQENGGGGGRGRGRGGNGADTQNGGGYGGMQGGGRGGRGNRGGGNTPTDPAADKTKQ